MKWAYGVTAVAQRRKDILPRTLASLRAAGFDKPRLFLDGEKSNWEEFGLEATCRYPLIRTFGNWILGLAEIYIREPMADRYAMFQDDFVCVKDLKAYLEKSEYPKAGYWNLYTFPQNEALANKKRGWFLSNQNGLGAVALVFDRKAIQALLRSHEHIIERPTHAGTWWRGIDGGIVDALKKQGIREWVHYPSLVQHTGLRSSMSSKPHPYSNSFPGENVSALEFSTA